MKYGRRRRARVRRCAAAAILAREGRRRWLELADGAAAAGVDGADGAAAEGLGALYGAFGRASAAFFAADADARADAEAMELDASMADHRGVFLLLAAGAKDCALIAFGMRPALASRVAERLWRPFLDARPGLGIALEVIDRECRPFDGCDLEGSYVAYRRGTGARAAFFDGPRTGEALYDAIGRALGYPHDRGFETDCRVEYGHGDPAVFVLEYEAHSDNRARVAAHFLSARAALRETLDLEIAVDGVRLAPDALAAAAKRGDRALAALWRRSGWAADERLGVRELALCRPPGCAGDIDFS